MSTADDVVIGEVDRLEENFFLQTARVSDMAERPLLNGDEWLAQNFTAEQLADPAISGWDADPEGDGIDNLTEFGLDTNPWVIESGVLEQLVEVVEEGGERFLQMTVAKNPKAAVSCEVGVTTDFSEWLSGSIVTSTLVDNAEQLVVRDRTPIEDLDSRFMRLRVILLQ